MKIRVAVFFGGQSCEHEISCISANQVIQALNKDKYEVIPVYIAKNKDMYTGDLLFDLANYTDLNDLVSKLRKVSLVKDGNHVYLHAVKDSLFKHYEQEIDVAFPVMHGTGGEDGTLQGLLEMMDLPYTSSSVIGSAVGQDKVIMKEILEYHHIPIVPWFQIKVSEFENRQAEYLEKAKALGFPLIVKPANLGSSIGIEVIHNEEEFADKVREAGKYDFKLAVEAMVKDLKEVNCSVIGSLKEAKTSAIEEVMKDDAFLTFDKKYLGGSKSAKTKGAVKAPTKGGASKGMASASRKVPADLSAETEAEIRKYALEAFEALEAHGCVRIDFMIDRADGKVYVNEINSIPGSLAFYLWQETGMGFDQECDVLIDNALKRKSEREKKVFSFDTNILQSYGRKK
ncbi:MAG: D-alanine--D-alanine ligase [Erysipelotrichaceae bacterium]|nr:D-alanine--D-alanine ligase [Erysipelotrichaceae bacterium]